MAVQECGLDAINFYFPSRLGNGGTMKPPNKWQDFAKIPLIAGPVERASVTEILMLGAQNQVIFLAFIIIALSRKSFSPSRKSSKQWSEHIQKPLQRLILGNSFGHVQWGSWSLGLEG